MKRFKDRRKVLSLSIVGIAYALIVIPLIISNIQKQQDIRSRSQVVDTTTSTELANNVEAQSSQSMCSSAGKTEIGVAYTNIDKSRSITVFAVDGKTGKKVDLGTISPEETKTATIPTDGATLEGGTVQFTVAYVDNPTQPEQKSSSYAANTCSPAAEYSIDKSVSITTNTPTTCGNVTTDVILIIDRSGSMGQESKLTQAKNAAKNFIDVVAQQAPSTRISMVSFSTSSTLSNSLSTDFNAVKGKIDSLTANGSTCHECGIKTANQEIASNGRSGVKKVVLLLTDGESNFISGGSSQTSASIGEAKALDAVRAGFSQSGTVFFSIGFDIKSKSAPQFLTQIATSTGGRYYFPAPDQLDGVYQEISQLIGKGIISGFVFNDANLSGSYDNNEVKISGRTLRAVSSADTKTASSDGSGNYSFGGLCDGSYKVSVDQQNGWTQTLPSDPAGYAIDITNATQTSDKHFGFTDKARCSDNLDNDNNGFKDSADSTCHTDGDPKNASSYDPKKDGEHGGGNTCADSKDNNFDGFIDGGDPVCHIDSNAKNPNSYNPNLPEQTTIIDVTVLLDGIGNRGDNTNPNDFSLSNKSPKNPQISADIQIFDLNNVLIASGSGNITYNPSGGNYLGSIGIESGFPSGKYTLKIKADTYLRKQVANIHTINSGQKNTITSVALIAGDVNNDNKLNILDYNLLLDCYSDLSAAANCPLTEKSVKSDLNDDGNVNQLDYNLFLREISTQPGQ